MTAGRKALFSYQFGTETSEQMDQSTALARTRIASKKKRVERPNRGGFGDVWRTGKLSEPFGFPSCLNDWLDCWELFGGRMIIWCFSKEVLPFDLYNI